MREPEARTDQCDRADHSRDTDTGREELEEHQRQPGDEQEVRDPRRVERVRDLLSEIELAEAHRLVVLHLLVRADADRLGSRDLHVAVRGVQDLTVEPDDELEERRLGSVDHLGRVGRLARRAVIDDDGDVTRIPTRAHLQRGRGRRCPADRQRFGIIEVDGDDRTEVRARGDRHVRRRPTRASRRLHERRRPTGRPRPRPEPATAVSPERVSPCRRRPRRKPSSWNTITEAREVLASRSDFSIRAAFDGSSRPLT